MRLIIFITVIISLLGCENIFTTNAFAGLKKDPSDMTSEELTSYANDVLSNPNATDAEIDEMVTLLASNRIEPTDEQLANDPELRDQYIEETLQLAALVQKKADVEDLLVNITSADEEEGNILGDLLDDQERVDDLNTASTLIAEAYKAEQLGGVTETSLEPTELILGSAGLVSDILQDEDKKTNLENAENLDTESLEAQGFTQEEIDNIQTAELMKDAALDSGGLSPDISDAITEGLPF